MTCAHSLQCKHPLLKAPDDYARLKAWHATVLVCMHPLHQPVKQWLVQGLDQRVPAYKNLGMHSCLCSAAFASGGVIGACVKTSPESKEKPIVQHDAVQLQQHMR